MKSELKRYISNTSLINDLISPSVSEVKDADNYRAKLLENFTKIGDLARDNVKILKTYYFPLINKPRGFRSEEIDTIREFSADLVDAYQLSFLDMPLVYRQAEILLLEAEQRGSEEDLILALDGMVSAAYAMICITGRLYPINDICLQYQKAGLRASERLLGYLDHRKFKKLSDELKEIVLINARYIRVVSEVDSVPYEEGLNEINLDRMKKALELKEDPFYSEQLPSYNWTYHTYRTLEYIASFTDQNNIRGFNEEELKYINECTKLLVEMHFSDEEYFKTLDKTHVVEIYSCRNKYLVGEIGLDEYKEELKRIFRVHSLEPAEDSSLAVLYGPIEYLLVCDRDNLSPEDVEFLKEFYSGAINYMHRTPKKNSLMFFLFFVYLILRDYVELPGGMDFETMSLSMLAAVHPITYVHTLSVAKLSVYIAKRLFERTPELFDDVPFINKDAGAKENWEALENYIYHAALCHDIGKLTIAETILTYGRNLLEEEVDLVRSHPAMGAYLLKKHESTKDYADVAEGHHKWYDDVHGYPRNFSLEASPYNTIIEIVTCADCMDASTDAIGRSYKDGKTLDRFIHELKQSSGERYAPYIADILEDPVVVKEIKTIITKDRAENYRKAFDFLKQHEGNC